MASITKLDSDGRQGYRVRFYVGPRQREIYLPGLTKKTERLASVVARYCDDLAQAKSNNVAPAADAVTWAAGTDGKLRENLTAWGLADPVSAKLTTDAGMLVGAFVTAYIDGRSDVKANTKINYLQTRRLLVEYFGESKPLKAVTQADADQWKRWMLSKKELAIATVSKHGKRAKTMFQHAVRDRLLLSSPFVDMKGGSESNSERQHFISQEVSEKVSEACPDVDWRLIFALSRFGGLRCPSEVLGLRWVDVDWDAGRLRIEAVKTELRFLPMFPEIRQALEESWEAAPDGSVYCVGRYRGGSANLRTQFMRILASAGITPWPKLFVNLRSTRRTELQEIFPDHVVNKWLGHSGKVAEEHYLQVTEEHWGKAIESRPLAGSLVTSHSGTISRSDETTKPSELLGSDGVSGLVIPYVMTPTGMEQNDKTQGMKKHCKSVPLPVPLSGTIKELLAIWNELDESARRDLLAVARGWVKVAP